MTLVSHWGLHIKGDLVFLHEQDQSECLTPGLKGLESPFEVKQKIVCPHQYLPLQENEAAPAPDELMRVISPVIDGGAYWAPPTSATFISNILDRGVFYPWATPIKKLIPQLNVTNIWPLVIMNYGPEHTVPLIELLSLPRIRTVLLCGPVRPPGVVEITDPGVIANRTSTLRHTVAEIVRKARNG